MSKQSRISETVIYEAYFDLWGFTVPWIESISEALSECYESGDTAERYMCDACMAFRFQSESKERVEKAKAVFRRLEPLAKRSMKGPRNRVYYHQ